ncbi:hypothetical protein D3C71_2115190 [compost metagenome]
MMPGGTVRGSLPTCGSQEITRRSLLSSSRTSTVKKIRVCTVLRLCMLTLRPSSATRTLWICLKASELSTLMIWKRCGTCASNL